MTAGLSAPRAMRKYESASSVATFHLCGEQYRRKYIAGEKDGDNLPGVAGSVLHSIFDEDVKGTPPADMLAEAKRRLRAVEGLEALPYWGAQNAEWWFREGLAIRLDNYHKVRDIWTAHTFEASEVELTVQLADDIPALRGYIDFVAIDSQGRRVLGDWKTGSPKDYQSFQMECYRVAYNLSHPDAPAEYSAIVNLKDKKGPRFALVPATLTVESLADMIRRVATATTFPFSGVHTGACNFCVYRGDRDNPCLPGQVGERSML